MSKPQVEMHMQLHKVGRGLFHLHTVNRQKQPQGWQLQKMSCRWCAQGGEQARAGWAAGFNLSWQTVQSL